VGLFISCNLKILRPGGQWNLGEGGVCTKWYQSLFFLPDNKKNERRKITKSLCVDYCLKVSISHLTPRWVEERGEI
jgi:hypothetical protein